MLDIKALKMALIQLEEEKHISQEQILQAIEASLAAAYKKEYGEKDQLIKARFNVETGDMYFSQVKIVADETNTRMPDAEGNIEKQEEGDERPAYNEERNIPLSEAHIMKADAVAGDEIVFPLETKDDFGRIAAQTAKQVIVQKIREAERGAIMGEYGSKEGQIVNGFVQRYERGIVYVDFNRATGIIAKEEQIPGERYERGQRIKAYLYGVEETPRGVALKLSRAHPLFIEKLFAIEAPEISSGVVEIRSIAREAGSRSKIAVFSNDQQVDATGSCIGPKGVRVRTVTQELSGEQIDIIEWDNDPTVYVSNALSPAQKILSIEIDEEGHKATVEVPEDILSLAIGKGGQNVRLANRLTGWKIDIKGVQGDEVKSEENADEGFTSLKDMNVSNETEEKTEVANIESEDAQ